MKFSYTELAVLNQMVSVAMLSGKIEFDEIAESIHKKITDEIVDRAREGSERKDGENFKF